MRRLYLSCFNNNGWLKQDLGNIYAMFRSHPSGESRGSRDQGVADHVWEQLRRSTAGCIARPSGSPGPATGPVRTRGPSSFWQRPVFRRSTAGRQSPPPPSRSLGAGPICSASIATSALVTASSPCWRIPMPRSVPRSSACSGMLPGRQFGAPLTAMLKDPSPKVRLYAAIGAGRCGAQNARPRPAASPGGERRSRRAPPSRLRRRPHLPRATS